MNDASPLSLILAGAIALAASAAKAAGLPQEGRSSAPDPVFEEQALRTDRRAKELTDGLRIKGKLAFLEGAGMESLINDDRKAAGDSFRRMIEVDPDNFRGYMHLGSMLLSDGDYAGAVALFEKGLKRDPEMMDFFTRKRAEALWGMGKTGEALADVEKVLERIPENGSAYLLRARILLSKGDFREAAKSYEASWRFSPHSRTSLDDFICGRFKSAGQKCAACDNRKG